MANNPENAFDLLWKEYGQVFRDFDDLTLARWMAQTLGQIEGRSCRQSHPLVGAYRLAAQRAHERQIWLQRLVSAPHAYSEAPCCRAPLLPLLTRDVRDTGLLCQHCGETLTPMDDIPEAVRGDIQSWAEKYGAVHSVAHREEAYRKSSPDYAAELDAAAAEAERMLVHAGMMLAPRLLEFYPAIIWEDQDECLEVRPEDVLF